MKPENSNRRFPRFLDILDKDGEWKIDLPARVIAAMYFPTDTTKRQQLQYGMIKPTMLKYYRAPKAPAEDISINYKLFKGLVDAREIHELRLKDETIMRNGIITAHWLHFRIWAAKHRRDLNTTEKWENFFNNELLAILIEQYDDEKLPMFGNSDDGLKYRQLANIRKEFFPVAHFWAAALLNPDFKIIYPDNKKDLYTQRMNIIFGGDYRSGTKKFLSIAESYRLEADKYGIYTKMQSGSTLDVWRAPKSFKLNLEPVADAAPPKLPAYKKWHKFLNNFKPHNYLDI